MKRYSHQDIADYYEQTEVHYRMWWNLEESLGLPYGVWDENTSSLPDAVINLNKLLCQLGDIKPKAQVLDAGCGVGGSSFYLAEKRSCITIGVTLSQKQVDNATQTAVKKGLTEECKFIKCSYTDMPFKDETFDASWTIESLGSANNEEAFFAEMHRILKPKGKILIADTFKSYTYPIEDNALMQEMLNPWAISDILSKDELIGLAEDHGFKLINTQDVTHQIKKSVNKMYLAAIIGMIGTKLYNMFWNASRFSKIHYKSGIAQKKTYEKGDWNYILFAFEKK